jgi:hypothetical protein
MQTKRGETVPGTQNRILIVFIQSAQKKLTYIIFSCAMNKMNHAMVRVTIFAEG